jgi:hypothetical protein
MQLSSATTVWIICDLLAMPNKYGDGSLIGIMSAAIPMAPSYIEGRIRRDKSTVVKMHFIYQKIPTLKE